jgi:hypothetical protein
MIDLSYVALVQCLAMKSRHVGVIVQLAEEFDYVREVLPMNSSEVIDGEQCHRFTIPQSAVTST